MRYIHTPEASTGGRFLARQLRLRRLRGEIPQYPRDATLVLNWGSQPQRWDQFGPIRVINNPAAKRHAGNKYTCLVTLRAAGIPTVPFSIEAADARAWLVEGKTVIERHTVTGSGGNGIRVVSPGTPLQAVPLYTQFVPSVREYRVHVIGEATLPARKARRNNAPTEEFPIRNHGDIWTFAYTIPPVHESVLTIAKNAVRAVGLDFGAVDILYQGNGRACVLEINTAPGLDHTVAEAFYVKELQGLVNG